VITAGLFFAALAPGSELLRDGADELLVDELVDAEPAQFASETGALHPAER
jgi:hypothetical protein